MRAEATFIEPSVTGDCGARTGTGSVPQLTCDILIIGAGPCGLGAAWEAERQKSHGDPTYFLVDTSLNVGGSAASVTTSEGFVFDFGGHILYPHPEYDEFIALLGETVGQWHTSKPVRGVWLDGRLIPYPIQRNIHRLRLSKFLSAFKGLTTVALTRRLGLTGRHPKQDLHGHLRAQFGNGLTKHVLGPINRKMWARDPRQLNASWTAHRSGSGVANVANASIRQTIRSVITRKDNLGWNETTRVRYPSRGGTGAIWTGLAQRLPPDAILAGRRVVEIDATARTALLDNGRHISYGHVISSIPIDNLLDLVIDNPVPELKGKFEFSSAAFVGLGFRGKPPADLEEVHSFHMPETDIPCWRVSFPKSLSPGNVPAGPYWSILCEISHSAAKSLDTQQLEDNIVAGLRSKGIIPPDSEIVSRWHSTMQHGYPLPFLGRDELLHRAQQALRALGILSRGRFGGWKYEVSNQDHSFMQGVEAVRSILDDAVETTYKTEIDFV